MTERFCESARRMRVLLMILLGASLAALGWGIYEAAGAYNAQEAFPVWPLARQALYKPVVYALILCGIWPGAKDLAAGAPRVLLLFAFAARTALSLEIALSLGGGAGVLFTVREVSGLVAAAGMVALLISGRAVQSRKPVIGLLHLAAMVNALTVAYLAVVGTLDGVLGVVDGLIGALPECLFGLTLAVFYGQLRLGHERSGGE